jgi:hypothetical protein
MSGAQMTPLTLFAEYPLALTPSVGQRDLHRVAGFDSPHPRDASFGNRYNRTNGVISSLGRKNSARFPRTPG